MEDRGSMGRMGPIFLGHVSFAQKDLSIEARKGQSGMGFFGSGQPVPSHQIYRVAQKTGPPAILSHCKHSENSMTELHGNWWTSAIIYAEHSH